MSYKNSKNSDHTKLIRRLLGKNKGSELTDSLELYGFGTGYGSLSGGNYFEIADDREQDRENNAELFYIVGTYEENDPTSSM